MAYITLANTNKIIFNSDIKKLDLSGELYKIPIYFFSKYEKNALLAIKELLKDPQKFFNEIYVPFKPNDTFSYVYEGKTPSYHDIQTCPRLTSKYENFEIPIEIKNRGNEAVQQYRKWFETVKDLLEKPDIFVARLQARWGIVTNPNAISKNNSGTTMIEELTIEELEKKIDEKIIQAGYFYNKCEKNQSILNEFSEFTYLANKSNPIVSNSKKTFTTKLIGLFLKENNIVESNNFIEKNSNNILFITFLKNDNNSIRLYFTKNSTVSAGDTVTRELLKSCTILYTANSNGEEFAKLSNNIELDKSNSQYTDTEIKELLREYDNEFKKPLKRMLIEYYRLKHNPQIKMEGRILEQIGFKPCVQCYNKRVNLEGLLNL